MIRRWINPARGRYYLVAVTPDLFGGLNLQRFWGGRDSNRGGQCAQHFDDPEVLAKHLHRIAARRRQRAYIEPPDPA